MVIEILHAFFDGFYIVPCMLLARHALHTKELVLTGNADEVALLKRVHRTVFLILFVGGAVSLGLEVSGGWRNVFYRLFK